MFPEDAAIKLSPLEGEEREKFVRDLTNDIDPLLVLDALKKWGNQSALANEHFKKRIRPCEDLFLIRIFEFEPNDDAIYESVAGYPFWFETEDFDPIKKNQQKIKDLIRNKDKKDLLELFHSFYEKQ
ncbi:MAG: hypothetical protein ACK5PQ_01890 [Alphaproteobacteria bacterium]